MAKNNKQEEEAKTGIENLNEHLTSAGRYVESNRKRIFWIVGILVVIAAFVISYLFIFRNPSLNKTMEQYAEVELKADNDSVAAKMYSKVAEEGSGNGAKLAALDAGQAYYRLGKYKEALKYLDKFETDDDVLMANALVLKGDCYVNLKQYDKALDTYNKAIKADDGNPEVAPRVMVKMANIYNAQKKYDKAAEMFRTIKEQYPRFQYGVGVDAYEARENARLGK